MNGNRGLDFKPIDPAAIPSRGNGRGISRYAATIGAFMLSGLPAIEVELNGTCVHTVAGQLQKAIIRAGLLSQAQAYERQGRVFVRRLP